MDIDFEKMGGLVPAIVQDSRTLKVLMLGYMNEEAYKKTLATKKATFYSRSRKRLWTKGETSGNYLDVVGVSVDCDNDALLVKAVPAGPVCHTGADTCWGEDNREGALAFISALQDLIDSRRNEKPEGSYTASLFNGGINKIAQKVGEEAVETVVEAVGGGDERLLYEASDLLYHLMVMLSARSLRIENVADELRSRHEPGWHKH